MISEDTKPEKSKEQRAKSKVYLLCRLGVCIDAAEELRLQESTRLTIVYLGGEA